MPYWPKPNFVRTKPLTLAAYEYGNPANPPLLLLHGALSTGLAWHDVATELANNWFVIAIDQRGRALSDHANDGDYSTDSYIRDTKSVLEHYSVEKLPIIGHSEGASNTVAFAAAHPESVTSIILIEHAPELDFAAMAKAAPPNAIPVPIGTNFANWQEVKEWQMSHLPGISEDAIKRRLHSRFVERDDHIEWREDTKIMEYKKNNPISSEQRWSILKQVRCRTLFLLSSHSNLITDETAIKAAKTVPHGSWLRTPNTGHNLFEDNPTQAVNAITDFLSADSTAITRN